MSNIMIFIKVSNVIASGAIAVKTGNPAWYFITVCNAASLAGNLACKALENRRSV